MPDFFVATVLRELSVALTGESQPRTRRDVKLANLRAGGLPRTHTFAPIPG